MLDHENEYSVRISFSLTENINEKELDDALAELLYKLHAIDVDIGEYQSDIQSC